MARTSATGENAAVAALTGLITHISLHTADPGTTGANEVTGGSYARVAAGSWPSASGGVQSNSGALTINVPASTTVAFFGCWTALSGGSYITGGVLNPSVTTVDAGTVTLAVGALTVSIA